MQDGVQGKRAAPHLLGADAGVQGIHLQAGAVGGLLPGKAGQQGVLGAIAVEQQGVAGAQLRPPAAVAMRGARAAGHPAADCARQPRGALTCSLSPTTASPRAPAPKLRKVAPQRGRL